MLKSIRHSMRLLKMRSTAGWGPVPNEGPGMPARGVRWRSTCGVFGLGGLAAYGVEGGWRD